MQWMNVARYMCRTWPYPDIWTHFAACHCASVDVRRLAVHVDWTTTSFRPSTSSAWKCVRRTFLANLCVCLLCAFFAKMNEYKSNELLHCIYTLTRAHTQCLRFGLIPCTMNAQWRLNEMERRHKKFMYIRIIAINFTVDAYRSFYTSFWFIDFGCWETSICSKSWKERQKEKRKSRCGRNRKIRLKLMHNRFGAYKSGHRRLRSSLHLYF